MSRRQQKSMWKEGHRRSPRISALDAWKAQPTSQVGTTTITATATPTVTNNNATANHLVKPQGPATRTRSRKKRKLRPLEDVAATSISPSAPAQEDDRQRSHDDHPINSDEQLVQSDNSPKNEDQASFPDQPSSAPSTLWMPEKRILELILDVLQRRDTHEIFAEPVDPEEVEDYYEIIKEPMDFGTMRAKLHEGMYKSLQQFEHDVFLISGNAMHFNPSATIYFRQARAIHELSTKVFQTLKTDPENFELEFSETRRRTGRRPHTEARGPFYRSSDMVSNISSKSMPTSLNDSSNLKKNVGRNAGSFGLASHFNARDHEVPSGAVDGRRATLVDRRCTYRPWTSFLNENDSIVSTIYTNSKPLMHLNQQDINYRQSLTLFVKDLGPTAKMIAKRKLLGYSTGTPFYQTSGSNYGFQALEDQNATASTCAKQKLTALDSENSALTSQNILDRLHGYLNVLGKTSDDLCDAHKGGSNYTGGSCSSLVKVALNRDTEKIPGALRGDVYTCNTRKITGLTGSDKVKQNGSTGIQLGSFSSFAGARDFSVSGLKETGNNPTTMILNKRNLDNEAMLLESALEHPQSDLLECRLKHNYKSSLPLQSVGVASFNQTKGFAHSPSSQWLRSNDQAIAVQGPSHRVSCSNEAGQAPKSSQQPSLASPFIFDLPYLKTRLDQINSPGQDRLSKSRKENSFADKVSYQRALSYNHQVERSTQPYNDDRGHHAHQQSSLDMQITDLALQL
ncbi:Bromodomain domain-containing protein [Cephalotus follicularis]|uniref:Bromodomain domain-containing protein n=1 Tax=Cephalotus follicularis TaxID=3775 RepID=A0A1Q3BAB8_CEPFO|nr:Bromodomain domain-containing protein [Cephalotus follicularis]